MVKVTIDTNVLFQALHSSRGASYSIFELIREDKIKMAISLPVFKEYEDVLLREKNLAKFDLTSNEIKYILEFIAEIAEATSINYLLRPNLKDENDNILVELAFASQSQYLITSNISDFKIMNELKIDSFQVVTPAIFLKEWRKQND